MAEGTIKRLTDRGFGFIATEGGMTIEVEMLIVLLIAFIGFTLFLIGQLALLWDLHAKEERLEFIAAKLDRRVTNPTN